jgi:hypothetical protein
MKKTGKFAIIATIAGGIFGLATAVVGVMTGANNAETNADEDSEKATNIDEISDDSEETEEKEESEETSDEE